MPGGLEQCRRLPASFQTLAAAEHQPWAWPSLREACPSRRLCEAADRPCAELRPPGPPVHGAVTGHFPGPTQLLPYLLLYLVTGTGQGRSRFTSVSPRSPPKSSLTLKTHPCTSPHSQGSVQPSLDTCRHATSLRGKQEGHGRQLFPKMKCFCSSLSVMLTTSELLFLSRLQNPFSKPFPWFLF